MQRKEQILKIQTATTEREFATIAAIKAKTVSVSIVIAFNYNKAIK